MLNIITREDKDGFHLDCKIEGTRGEIAQEVFAVLNEIAKADEELVAKALDLYLNERGF